MFGNLENPLLRIVEQRLHVTPGRIQCIAGNLVTDRDQLAQYRTFAHDLGVAANVGCRRRCVGNLGEICQSTGLVGFIRLLDGLVHRHHVGRTALLAELADVTEDSAMIVAIKVGLTHHVGDLVPRRVVDQQTADQ